MAKKDEVETVRLRNVNSGAVVTVAAEKVDRMGSEWEPAKASGATKKASSS